MTILPQPMNLSSLPFERIVRSAYALRHCSAPQRPFSASYTLSLPPKLNPVEPNPRLPRFVGALENPSTPNQIASIHGP